MNRRLREDRGSYAVETAILAPALLALVGLMVAFGRVSIADSSVDSAARSAARAASLARTAGDAEADALTAARASLTGSGIHCSTLDISVDTSGFATAVGEHATVTAEVSCTASLADISVPGLPGSTQLSASFTSPLDTYRARTSS
ncbi:TadE/TadG family type IV pilus assembly protein [Streptomyces aculeolatus]